MSEFAREHKVPVSSLQRWVTQLHGVESGDSETRSRAGFMEIGMPVPSRCRVCLTVGAVRLELEELPSPEWLAALGKGSC